MNLYKLTQYVNNNYDTYDSAVVAAMDDNSAKRFHPSGSPTDIVPVKGEEPSYYDWASLEDIQVEFIGTTELPAGVVIASFNAG